MPDNFVQQRTSLIGQEVFVPTQLRSVRDETETLFHVAVALADVVMTY
jgi:hypothetical protein